MSEYHLSSLAFEHNLSSLSTLDYQHHYARLFFVRSVVANLLQIALSLLARESRVNGAGYSVQQTAS
jgi:hypothetical protein